MDQQTPDYGSLLDAWMRAFGELVSMTSRFGASTPDTYGMPEEAQVKKDDKLRDSISAGARLWSTYASVLNEPHVMQALLQGSAVIPDLTMRIARSGLQGYLDIQRQWMEKTAKAGRRTEAYRFEPLDENVFRTLSEIYEREISPLLKAPQLGLMRFYQERANLAVDRYNQFQAELAEFLRILALPMEKTAKVLQQKLEEMTREGKLPENPQEYYRLWVRILEGHYMTLFKSSDYTDALGRMLEKLGDFLVERQRVLQDMLQTLPVPTHKEMDELYRELHALKRELRDIKKKRRGNPGRGALNAEVADGPSQDSH